jgi:hypothetical protein
MKKSHLILLLGGALVAIGMVVSYYGSSLTIQDLTKAEGPVNENSLEVTKELDPIIATIGVFVVHVENFEKDSLLATVFDPNGIQVASKRIEQKDTEEKFEIKTKGAYELILENSAGEAFATIGLLHMPEKSILLLNVLGQSIIFSGLVGVGIAVIYHIKSRKRKIS